MTPPWNIMTWPSLSHSLSTLYIHYSLVLGIRMITTVLDIVFAECLSQNQTTKLQTHISRVEKLFKPTSDRLLRTFFAFVVSFFLVLSASFQVVEATLTTHSQWWNMMNFQVFFCAAWAISAHCHRNLLLEVCCVFPQPQQHFDFLRNMVVDLIRAS